MTTAHVTTLSSYAPWGRVCLTEAAKFCCGLDVREGHTEAPRPLGLRSQPIVKCGQIVICSQLLCIGVIDRFDRPDVVYYHGVLTRFVFIDYPSCALPASSTMRHKWQWRAQRNGARRSRSFPSVCKDIRKIIADEYDIASDRGISKKLLKIKIKERDLKSKVVKVTKDLQADERSEFQMLSEKLGEFADTPLGAAALARADGSNIHRMGA